MKHHNQTERYDTPGADAVDLAFSWLSERHEEELDYAIDAHFFFGLKESQRNRLAKLPEPMQVMIDVNGREQVVAEGILHLPVGSITCLDLLLGPDGPELASVQRHYLEALARPMSIYRVVETKPDGLFLRDLLDDREAERWVAEPLASTNFAYQPGKALSSRLIPGDPWHLGRALYPTAEPMLSFLLDQIRAARALPTPPGPEFAVRSMMIIYSWLSTLSYTPLSKIEDAIREDVH